MPSSLLDRPTEVLPGHWPAALHPARLGELTNDTPFLACDLSTVEARYHQLREALPGVEVFYAVKCNSSPQVLQRLASLGSSFEVASIGELEMLTSFGVDPASVLYSNTVKPSKHVAAASAAGLWRFAVDSEGELYKLARCAPGAAVQVRLRVDDSTSVFPLSRKFGCDPAEAVELMLLARSLDLVPYGVTFHVGSQCGTPSSWRQAIAATGHFLGELAEHGIELEMLDMGGGFPARYLERVPAVESIGRTILAAVRAQLPYVPRSLAVEPGRFLVAESGVMTAGILGREERAGESWLYLDVGVYNGLMETQQTGNQWRFPLWTSRADHDLVPHMPFTVTGPSCDSSDTLFYGVLLPSTLDIDDRLYIGCTGAYTLSYASSFNGFPPPESVYV